MCANYQGNQIHARVYIHIYKKCYIKKHILLKTEKTQGKKQEFSKKEYSQAIQENMTDYQYLFTKEGHK